MQQLELFPVEDDYFLSSTVNFRSNKVSSTNFVEDGKSITEKKVKPVEDTIRQASSTASISTYSPSRRKTKYFRLVYRDATKVKAVHIPGGNINSLTAIRRAEKLQDMINYGASIQELLSVLANYR